MKSVRSVLVIVALLALAVSSLWALKATAWWKFDGIEVFPTGTSHCFGGECTAGGLMWLDPPTLWLRAAVALQASVYLLTLGLIALSASIASRRRPVLLRNFVWVCTATTIACATVFVGLSPEMLSGNLAFGVYLLAATCVLAPPATLLAMRFGPQPVSEPSNAA